MGGKIWSNDPDSEPLEWVLLPEHCAWNPPPWSTRDNNIATTTVPPGKPTMGQRLAKSVSAAWRKLKSLLRRARRFDPHRDEVFEKIDIEALQQELRLQEDAIRLGSKGLPAYEARDLDGPQTRILQHLRNELSEGFRRTNTRLSTLWSALHGRDIGDLVRAMESLPAAHERETAEQLRILNTEAEALKRERSDVEQNIAGYRTRHQLERGPELKEGHERWWLTAVTVGVAILQALFNAAIFAQGMTFGIAQGALLAFLLGLADIFVHLALGNTGRLTRSPEKLHKTIGSAGLVLAVATVVGWNLGMVHLRLVVLEFGFIDGSSLWLDSIRTSPFGFSDFMSVALLLVGILCSTSAAAAGFFWDEPIPAYRKLGRKLRDLEEELAEVEEELAETEEERASELRKLIEKHREDIRHNVRMADSTLRDIQAVHENLLTHIADSNHAFQALIRYYRGENELARSGVAPPPPYFQRTPEFDLSRPMELDVSLEEMKAFVERQHALAQQVLGEEDKP